MNRKKNILLVLILVTMLTGCASYARNEDNELVKDEINSLATENLEVLDVTESNNNPLCIDSSITSSNRTIEEKLFVLENYRIDEVDEIFVYINAGTAQGLNYTISKEDYEKTVKDVASIVFNDYVEYKSGPFSYGAKEYDFYIVFKDYDTNEEVTIFVFDTEKICYEGTFFYASQELVTGKINSIIKGEM